MTHVNDMKVYGMAMTNDGIFTDMQQTAVWSMLYCDTIFYKALAGNILDTNVMTIGWSLLGAQDNGRLQAIQHRAYVPGG